MKKIWLFWAALALLAPAWIQGNAWGERPRPEKAQKKTGKERKPYTHEDGSHRFPGKVVGVWDGDTVSVEIYGLREECVRLIYVDTPELAGREFAVDLPFSVEAKAFCIEKLLGQDVDLSFDGLLRDHYRRLLAVIWIGPKKDETFQEMLIEEGFSDYYTDYGSATDVEMDKQLCRESLKAIENKKRIWNENKKLENIKNGINEYLNNYENIKRPTREWHKEREKGGNVLYDQLLYKVHCPKCPEAEKLRYRCKLIEMNEDGYKNAKKAGNTCKCLTLKTLNSPP